MEKFKDYKYERPDILKFEKVIKNLINEFESAENIEVVIEKFDLINSNFEDFYSMASLSEIRNTINCEDEFYEKEEEFFAKNSPKIQKLNNDFNKTLISTKWRSQLEDVKGKYMFTKIEAEIKTFSPEIMKELEEEKLLVLEYEKLKGSAQVEYKGKKLTLAQLSPFMQDKNREIRKESSDIYYGFMADNMEKFDEIYDKLVKVRHAMAKKLGFENFVELGYLRMLRTDYNAADVEKYREFIGKYAVPLSNELRERQRQRLKLDKLKLYDLPFEFPSGNPTPKGDPEWIINQAIKMYDELSPETSKFFRFMYEKELLDLIAKKGKIPGGYCSYIPNYKSPFIFSNFNGTQNDVEVLTHEVGHAFQVYNSRNLESSYVWATYEASEVHSMSMEFLTYPWMKNFFKEDIEKFKFSHIQGTVLFLPYGVSVDEFQHFVYENPEATPVERRAKWREIEKKYTPYKDYSGNKYLEEGGLWHKQGHIFSDPFYYIDYTLAQICALQFYKKSNENREKAWNDYLNLCKLGGSKAFLGLIESAGLKSPFKDGLMEELMGFVKKELDNIDDKSF